MAKNPTGVFSRGTGKKRTWWARYKFKDEDGKIHDLSRRAESQAHAAELRKELEKQYRKDGGRTLLNASKTFADLAEYYKKHYLKPAEYHKETGRKIAGLRSYKSALGQLDRCIEFFKKIKLQNLGYENLRAFRKHRLDTPIETELNTKTETMNADGSMKIVRGKEKRIRPRAIASVNREMALLRKMLNVAERLRWIERSPFKDGDSLISIADERKRERILTQAEEKRLLSACTGRREHLRAILICALDTGMRRNEILSLRWSQVNFEENKIRILATNTKTMRERFVPISSRLKSELLSFWNSFPSNESLSFTDDQKKPHHVFKTSWLKSAFTDVKRSFEAARSEANLTDVRFHDLRHTAATRLIREGLPQTEVGRILGHTQTNTTYRYVNADDDTLKRAAAAMNNYQDFVVQSVGSDLVN